jgi:hypothetical protein
VHAPGRNRTYDLWLRRPVKRSRRAAKGPCRVNLNPYGARKRRRKRHRLGTTARGYGTVHQNRRKALARVVATGLAVCAPAAASRSRRMNRGKAAA